jgi:alpha-mannosidase
METVGSRIDTRGEGTPVVIYNSLAWQHTGLVSVDVRFVSPVQTFAIKDAQGNEIPYIIDDISPDRCFYQITLLAAEVPSAGFRMVRAYAGQHPEPVEGVKAGKDFAENEFYRIKWNSEGVTSIVNKQSGRELLTATGNQLMLLEAASNSAWGMQLTGTTVPMTTITGAQIIENNPLRVTVQWEEVAGDSRFVRQMMIEKGMPQVKFRIRADWREHDRVLKVLFPVALKNGTATYENPYGTIERPLAGAEFPAQNWIDLSGDGWGISMFNDGRNAFTLDDGLMGMTVLYNSRDMDPRMDHGDQEVCYALTAHAGDWRGNRIVQRAMEFNRPLTAMQEYKHIAQTSGWTTEIALNTEESFYRIAGNDHVIISAIKVLQENWAPEHVVLRIVETEGRDDQATVFLPATLLEVIESDHIENPLPNQPAITRLEKGFSFAIGHHQIRTFIVRLGK